MKLLFDQNISFRIEKKLTNNFLACINGAQLNELLNKISLNNIRAIELKKDKFAANLVRYQLQETKF